MISSEIGKEVIKKELALIPKLPGVYKMINSKNEILYVGKAKNLPRFLKFFFFLLILTIFLLFLKFFCF